jgi:hypothetical protein
MQKEKLNDYEKSSNSTLTELSYQILEQITFTLLKNKKKENLNKMF